MNALNRAVTVRVATYLPVYRDPHKNPVGTGTYGTYRYLLQQVKCEFSSGFSQVKFAHFPRLRTRAWTGTEQGIDPAAARLDPAALPGAGRKSDSGIFNSGKSVRPALQCIDQRACFTPAR
jgi:hypothetical protein